MREILGFFKTLGIVALAWYLLACVVFTTYHVLTEVL